MSCRCQPCLFSSAKSFVVQVEMRQQMLDLNGPCIKLSGPPCDTVRRVQRLFFLNEAQNLSSFLVADLGVAKYPSYRVSRSRSVFTTRQDLLDYEQALLHAAELDNALEVSNMLLPRVHTIVASLFS